MDKLREYLGITEERFPKKVGFEFEFQEIFKFPKDFDETILNEICILILDEFGNVLVEKNLLETNWTTSSWKEASKNFISRTTSKLEKFLTYINFEKLYKLLFEEFWWKMYGLTTYEEFAHISSPLDELSSTNPRERTQNSPSTTIVNSSDGIYNLSKQFQDFIRYMIWGYHYATQFEKKKKKFICRLVFNFKKFN